MNTARLNYQLLQRKVNYDDQGNGSFIQSSALFVTITFVIYHLEINRLLLLLLLYPKFFGPIFFNPNFLEQPCFLPNFFLLK